MMVLRNGTSDIDCLEWILDLFVRGWDVVDGSGLFWAVARKLICVRACVLCHSRLPFVHKM